MNKKHTYFIALVLFLGVIQSCTKNDTGPEFFVSIRTDTGLVTFDGVGEYGIDENDSSYFKLLINGKQPQSCYSFHILIRRKDSIPLEVGLYKTNSIDYEMIVSYTRPDSSINLEYFHSKENVPNREPSLYTAKISKITDEIIEGDFFGNYLTKVGTIDSSLVTIHEGNFRVKRFR